MKRSPPIQFIADEKPEVRLEKLRGLSDQVARATDTSERVRELERLVRELMERVAVLEA